MSREGKQWVAEYKRLKALAKFHEAERDKVARGSTMWKRHVKASSDARAAIQKLMQKGTVPDDVWKYLY